MELFPIVPIMGNVSIGAGALSYAGQFNITLVADRDLVPDLGIAAAAMRAALLSMALGRSRLPVP